MLDTIHGHKAFIFSGLFLTFIYFIGASGQVYLFDNSIVYYFGYLLSIGYEPYTDFSTPLLPLIGLLQSISYKIFGFTYFSGVYTAFLLLIIEYTLIYSLILKIINNKNLAITFSFLSAIGCIGFTSNLYYNHIIFSLATLWFYLSYYKMKISYGSSIVKYGLLLITIVIFFIKFHFGILLVGFQIINDVLLNKSLRGMSLIKYLFKYLIMFIIVGYTIFFYSNNASILHFLDGLEKISDNFSLMDNINTVGLARILLSIPMDLFSLIEVNPFSLSLILLAPLATKFNSFKNMGMELFLVVEVLITAVMFIVNSFEGLSILFPFQIVILFLVYLIYRKNNISGGHINVIYSFLILHFLYSFFYVINSNRKSYDELNAKFQISTFSVLRNDLLSTKIDKLKSNRAKSFYKGTTLSDMQIVTFNNIDSVMSYYKPNSVYFGPELEMFNIIYKIKPFKGFPVWVHPGLTVSGQMNTVLSKKLAMELPEIMFISRSRQHFLDYLDHQALVDNGYVLQNADSLDSFVLCYVYHDLLDTDDPVDFPKNQIGN